MEYELSNTEKDIIMAASEFANKEFSPILVDCDDGEKFPKEVWKKACDEGFVGAFIGSNYGGNDLNMLQYCLILKEFWKVDPGCGNLLLTTLGAEMIGKYGTVDQKNKYLPKLVKGELISSVGIFEQNGNYEVTPHQTICIRKGGRYFVSGEKTFVINGSIANYILTLCLDLEDNSYNMLIVNTQEEGFKSNKLRDKLGIRATDIAQVYFDNVVSEDILGKRGSGLEIAKHFLEIAKLYECAQGLGLAAGGLQKSIEYSKKRHQFGRPIKSFQAIQQKIADMYIKLQAGESLFYRTCYYFEKKRVDYGNWITITNIFIQNIVSYILYETVQIYGGYGYVKEEGIERLYRDGQFIRFFNEPAVIERTKLGEFLTE